MGSASATANADAKKGVGRPNSAGRPKFDSAAINVPIGERELHQPLAQRSGTLPVGKLSPVRPAVDALMEPEQQPVARVVIRENKGPQDACERDVRPEADPREHDGRLPSNAFAPEPVLQVLGRTLLCCDQAIALVLIGRACETVERLERRQADRERRCIRAAGGSEHHQDRASLRRQVCVETEIDPDECLDTVKAAEGGAEKEKLSELIRLEAALAEAIKLIPAAEHIGLLATIAKKRDHALAQTQGDQFLNLYKAASVILDQEGWEDKLLCPVCDIRGETAPPEHVAAKAAHYTTVTEASEELKAEWEARSWDELTKLEALVVAKEEATFIRLAGTAIKDGKFDHEAAVALEGRLQALQETADTKLAETAASKDELEGRLPKSLVNITEKVEATRRLQAAIIAHEAAIAELDGIEANIAIADRVKTFLDKAASIFAVAESDAAKRRLEAVEPICQDYFANIMHQQVIPSISKPEGSEELTIALAQFHSLTDISAAAVLSESFRNAFSISLYLAAASLYGGAAKFLVLGSGPIKLLASGMIG